MEPCGVCDLARISNQANIVKSDTNCAQSVLQLDLSTTENHFHTCVNQRNKCVQA